MKHSGTIGCRVFFYLLLPALAFLVSCQSSAPAGEGARTPTAEVRLNQIREQISVNPVMAMNQIGIFREMYSLTRNDSSENWTVLASLEEDALEGMHSFLANAVEEERWDDAASLNRSLSSLGYESYLGSEADFILAGAKKNLAQGNNLAAFLSAASAHVLSPLDFESSMMFLERAVEERQRRTASFFLTAADNAAAASPGAIPADWRIFAEETDSVTEMLRGVGTVLVDRGMRVEFGRAITDRVIGSAFFIDSSGLMITNYHVISSEVDTRFRGNTRISVRMGNAASPSVPARVVGWDRALDLALLQVDMRPDFVFSVVDWIVPEAGDTVLAMGSPAGLDNTVTAGIVSALGRRFLQIGDVYQIDAAVNMGNSGGPVVDSRGRLVGVVFAGILHLQGLNFAIPAEWLVAALPEMMGGGRAQRPWLGLTLNEGWGGAEVIYVSPNTPAWHHRLPEGTVITAVNDRQATAQQGMLIPVLQDVVFRTRVGELVALDTQGPNGERGRRVVMTTVRPELPLLEAARLDSRERIVAPLFGMVLTPFGTRGLFSPNFVVSRVVRGSIADEAGISEHDPISIRRLRLLEDSGFAVLEVSVQKRRMGFVSINMQLPAWLDSPDTL
ncbi:MAG: trypsin-like peptidase domain-containing protein [Spirochaetes bacterium]|nr:trypsin-like peptidase domain-containing protein [Spirochaetota bacterium]